MGLIPVNPSTGIPSRTHYECLTANRRYGFLPLDNEVVVSNSYNRSILDGDDPRATSYFDSTPVFMDALVTIADGLFKFPRELRNDESKKRQQQPIVEENNGLIKLLKNSIFSL